MLLIKLWLREELKLIKWHKILEKYLKSASKSHLKKWDFYHIMYKD